MQRANRPDLIWGLGLEDSLCTAIEEALFIMVKAYDEMGMIDLRDDAERVMRKNYPNSVYYTRGLNRVEPWWKLW